ncbi:hypothetical protein ACET94_16755 [Aeromonas veronii]
MSGLSEALISKTTIKYALKRRIDLEVNQDLDDITSEIKRTLWFTEVDERGELACEPFVIYLVNGDGSFSFYGNVYLPDTVKEELPAYIENEKKLRAVLDYMFCELSKNNK